VIGEFEMDNQTLSNRARPLLALYVVWHPDFQSGPEIAEALREHFRRQVYSNVAGGTGLSVIFRSTPVSEFETPLPINLDSAQANAIVVLCEESISKHQAWIDYVKDLSEQTEKAGLSARLFPISVDPAGLSIGLEEQALRWDQWTGNDRELTSRLISELAYEFCRMLRCYLERLRHPAEDDQDLEKYLQKVQIFLSHSKHDGDGERIAHKVRDELHAGHGLASFFDVHDIPAGLRFHNVLLKQVSQSAVVAIHTDSYSSREWCRREIIEAKRHNVPLVVANCISDRDERGFPYLGNVPIVRMNPNMRRQSR